MMQIGFSVPEIENTAVGAERVAPSTSVAT